MQKHGLFFLCDGPVGLDDLNEPECPSWVKTGSPAEVMRTSVVGGKAEVDFGRLNVCL